jgi:hypothetical protein
MFTILQIRKRTKKKPTGKTNHLEGHCVFDLKATAYFIATILFPETHLHERLELEQGAIWFLEKEPLHWTIHFPEAHLQGTRSFKNTESPPT